jgi:hypothetical protein
VAQVHQATSFDQPEIVGIEPDEQMFQAAESQRMAAASLVGSMVLLVLFMVLRIKSPFMMSFALAMSALGAMAVIRLAQAIGSGLLRTLVFAMLAFVPGPGTLMVAWTYFRAAGVLKENGLTTRNSLLDADEVRELGGRDGMLPSTKLLLALLVLAAVGGYAFINQIL